MCSFCGRPRTLRREEHMLGALVRTIVTCETCHRTLSSSMGVAAEEPAAAPEAKAPPPERAEAEAPVDKAPKPRRAPAKRAASKPAGASSPKASRAKPAARSAATKKK